MGQGFGRQSTPSLSRRDELLREWSFELLCLLSGPNGSIKLAHPTLDLNESSRVASWKNSKSAPSLQMLIDKCFTTISLESSCECVVFTSNDRVLTTNSRSPIRLVVCIKEE